MAADTVEEADRWVCAIAGRLYLNELQLEEEMLPEYISIYDLFDTNGKGGITLDELQAASEGLGNPRSEHGHLTDELKATLTRLQIKADAQTGLISLPQFLKVREPHRTIHRPTEPASPPTTPTMHHPTNRPSCLHLRPSCNHLPRISPRCSRRVYCSHLPRARPYSCKPSACSTRMARDRSAGRRSQHGQTMPYRLSTYPTRPCTARSPEAHRSPLVPYA